MPAVFQPSCICLASPSSGGLVTLYAKDTKRVRFVLHTGTRHGHAADGRGAALGRCGHLVGECPPPKFALPKESPLGLATNGRYALRSNRVKQKSDVFRVMACPDRG
jgi:hypothetical protein